MAFLLRTDGVDDYVILDQPINVNLGLSAYSIEIKVAVSVAVNTYILGQNQTTQSNVLALLANGRIQISVGGSAAWFSNAGLVLFDGLAHIYRVEHDANGQLRFYRDGELFQSRTYNANLMLAVPFNTLFRLSASSSFSAMDFYYLNLSGFTNSGNWNPSVIQSDPDVLVDVLNVNHGTMINFQNNLTSGRIFYDDGNTDEQLSTIVITMPQLQPLSTVIALTPEIETSVALEMPKFVVNTSVTTITSELAALVFVSMPQFAVNSSGKPNAPHFESVVSITMPQFLVIATGRNDNVVNNALVSIAMPHFTANIEGNTNAPTYETEVSYVMPQFTVRGLTGQLIESINGSVSISMPQLNAGVTASTELFYSAYVSAIMPMFSLGVVSNTTAPITHLQINLQMPQFGVSILTGEMLGLPSASFYIELQEPETHIEIREINRHFEITNLSTHTEWRN